MSEEARREQILKAREENQRTAEKVEQGTAYHEPVTVYFTDRALHTVEVFALSGKQFRAAMKKTGVDPTVVGKPEKLLESLEFVAFIAELATKDPDLSEKLLVNEDAKIATKAFELMNPPKDSAPS